MHVLEVTTAATDIALLTQPERRAAVGVTDSSADSVLADLAPKIDAAIMAECGIAIGSGHPPTLLQETLTETFYQVDARELVLARRHEIEVVSVTVDGTALAASDYLVEPESGLLYRLLSDIPSRWCARKIVVVYKAGFTTIPDDLKKAAQEFMRLAYLGKDRDPAVKMSDLEVFGVQRERAEYWIGPLPGQTIEAVVPPVVAGYLKRFRNYAVG